MKISLEKWTEESLIGLPDKTIMSLLCATAFHTGTVKKFNKLLK